MIPDPASKRRLKRAHIACQAESGQAGWVRLTVGLGLGVLVLLSLAAMLVWGPHLGRHWIASQLAATLGRPVEIARIIHRPWRGEIEVQGLTLQTLKASFASPSASPSATGTSTVVMPAVRLDRLRLQLRLNSLLSHSLQVSELVVDGPQVVLHRDAQGVLDLADVWARLTSPDQTGPAWVWRIDRIQVRDGQVRVHDALLQATLGLDEFRLDARDLTPQGLGASAELSGRLLGASLALQGRLEGSAQDPRGQIDLAVSSLDLTRLMPWVQAISANPLLREDALRRGQLSQGQATITWRPRAQGPERLVLQGQLKLEGLHWARDPSDDAPWSADLQLASLHLAFGPTTPLGGEVRLASLDLQGGRGRWRDLRQNRMPEGVVDALAVQGRDLLWPLGQSVDRTQGHLSVQALIDGASAFQAESELTQEQALIRATIRQWQAGPWLAALIPASSPTVRIDPLDLEGELTWAPAEARWTLSRGQLRTPGWSLRDGHATLVQAKDSRLSSLRAQGQNGRWQIDALQLDLKQLQILDRPKIPDVSAQGRIGPAAPGLQGAWPVQTALRIGTFGQIEAEGTLDAQAPSFDGGVALKGLDLQLMRPELEQYLRMDVQQGRLSGTGQVKVLLKTPTVERAPHGTSASASFEGALALTDLRTVDRQSAQPLVALRAFNLPEVRLAWAPLHTPTIRMVTGPMTLMDLDARLTLEADGQLNLKRILAAPRSELKAVRGQAAAPQQATADPVPSAFSAEVRLGPLRIAGAQIDFNDQFIQPHYRAKLSQLHGSISPLLGEPEQFSDIDLRGQVDGDTPVEITGQVRALGAAPSLDLRAVARGFDLPKLSPYSAKWAGYAIEKGSLTANVRYRLRGQQLEAENRLIIHQLTFGDPVASPDALKWPVQLAVSLLKDEKGVIDLDLPIAGSLSDPQFSVGGLIWRALGNLVLKTVSAPFTALASLLRGSMAASELAQIVFAPGTTELDEDAKRRLTALAQALTERPEIRLELIGQADPLTDREALSQKRPRDAITDDDLRELAQGRAQNARRHLREVHGLPQERMFIRAPRWSGTDGTEPVRGVSFELR